MRVVEPDRIRYWDTGGERPEVGAPPEVATERVVAKVSGPALGGASGGTVRGDSGDSGDSGEVGRAGDASAFEVPWGGLRHPPAAIAILAVVAVLGIGTWLVSADIRIGVMCPLVVALAGIARSVDRHVQFSFGEGFVGYRPDTAWPQGVQEDDDVRWDWRPHRPSGEMPPQ